MGIVQKLRSIKITISLPKINKRTRIYILVYSIELVVMMLGVTAGFTLTNWAETRKEYKLANEYMKSLQSDLEIDIKNLHFHDSINAEKIEEMTQLLILLKTNNQEEMLTINNYVSKAIRNTSFFHASKTTYESIKQGGQINIIKDMQLKNELISLYESQYEELKISETILLEDIRNRLEPIVMEQYDIIEFEILNKDKLFDYRFANLVHKIILDLSESAHYYKESLAKCEEIKKRLQAKLDN